MSGFKFGLAHAHISHQDWVSLDWFRQFTSAWPSQYLTISILNGSTRLRLEFILHNHHHTLTFESLGVKILIPAPYISHQDCVFLDCLKQFTSAWPFQYLIICILNGSTRLRLEFGLKNGHYNYNLFLSHEWVQILLGRCPLFPPRLSVFGLIQAIHISLTLPISHH